MGFNSAFKGLRTMPFRRMERSGGIVPRIHLTVRWRWMYRSDLRLFFSGKGPL